MMMASTSKNPLPVLTVDDLTAHLQETLSSDPLLQRVGLRGEIAEIKHHTSGHVYFTLKGEETRVSCVIFRSDAQTVLSWPAVGDEVLAEGRIGIYGARGAYQLYAYRLLPIGRGAQARAREALRNALEREGLFDPRIKRAIPPFPEKVAVVSSRTGAAVRDVIKVARSRFPQAEILVIPAQVQGLEAPDEITEALSKVRKLQGLSVVLLVRGGGSRDDLTPFDDERVVRAVRLCPVPVVTGIGHQIDLTLTDLAADAFAPTPSAAAERVFPDRLSLKRQVGLLEKAVLSAFLRTLARKEAELSHLWDFLKKGFLLSHLIPAEELVKKLKRDLNRECRFRLERGEAALSAFAGSLDSLSPLRILSRGFVACGDEEGRPLRRAAAVRPGNRLRLRFCDGEVATRSESVRLFDKEDS